MIKELTITTLGLLAGLSLASQSLADTTYYYNRSGNPGWSGGTSWGSSASGPFNSNWVAGAIAYTGSGSSLTINLTQDVVLGGLLRDGTGTFTLSKSASPSSPVSMTFTGGTIDAGSSVSGLTAGIFDIGNGVTITGTFTLTRGALNLTGNVGNFQSHSGAITVAGGTLNISAAARLSSSSNLNLQGGSTFFKASSSVGDVQINGGALIVGAAGGVNGGYSVELKSLSGSSGVLRANLNDNLNSSPFQQITINQAANTLYAGTIEGSYTAVGGTGVSSLQLKKSGAGDLALSGTIQGLRRTTTVDGGRLYVNGNSTSFGDTEGSTAISVASGGALGGTGVITTLAGDNVVVSAGGKLIAGTFDQAGRTTYALGIGSSLDLSAATAGTEWLRFDLGSTAQAGTTYSQILLSGGTLAIGSGTLEFDDFNFNALAGFGGGTYTLFSVTGNSTILGSLGASTEGEINGMTASLLQDASGIYLTVIPEPGMTLLGLLGGSVLFLYARRRR